MLDELYRLTPMEETFGINNVALVDGQPRVLGLRELLQIYVDHRIEVVRRRCEFRRRKRADRLHLVDGLLIALLNIDEVIQVIRTSDDSAQAKERLMSVFDLSEIQAQYILDTPLRRLTRYDRLELERERETLQRGDRRADRDPGVRGQAARAGLRRAGRRRRAVRQPAAHRAAGRQRQAARTAAVPLEVADDPCLVLLSSAGLIARTATRRRRPGRGHPGRPPGRRRHGAGRRGPRTAHDVIIATACRPPRGAASAVVTSRGPADPDRRAGDPGPAAQRPLPRAGRRRAASTEFVSLDPGETVVGAGRAGRDSRGGLALGTAGGVVKRVAPDYPANATEFEVISLKEGDRVVGAVQLASEDADLVFITSDAPAAPVPRRGGAAAGPGGRRDGRDPAVGPGGGGLVRRGAGPAAAAGRRGRRSAVVVTVAGSSGALPGTAAARSR